MIQSYSPRHNKKKKKPAALITLHCLSRGYLTPRHSSEQPYRRPAVNRTLKRLCALITALVIADTLLFSMHISTIKPYAITSNDKVICYVETKEDAERAIKETAKKLTGSDMEIASVDSNLEITKAPLSKKSEVTENAADIISEKTKSEDIKIEAKVLKTETFDKEPEPIIEEDADMLAGQSEVVSEGSAGKGEKVYKQTIVNGEIVDEEKVCEQIKEEGTPAVIKKGTKGLPEGEDYKTYEGLPVCKSGKDIMDTAASYIDKVPYVWGGKDLETGVDCSGFVIAIYRLYGIELDYPLEKEGVSVPYNEAMPGDILCFPGHFGLYLGDGKMIHASKPGTYVMESSIGSREILDVRRIIEE